MLRAGQLQAVALALAVSSPAAFPTYLFDAAWNPAYPKGTGTYSAVDVSSTGLIFVSQRDARYPQPVLVFDKTGKFRAAFGADGVGTSNGTWGGHSLVVQRADIEAGRADEKVWVMDFLSHSVMSFSLEGKLLGKAGGDGSKAFGNVADAAFRGSSAYFADGDGGGANRVERWGAASGQPESVEWISPAQPTTDFLNPHSVCWHKASDRLLVADRDHARIAIVEPETGRLEGNLSCPKLNLGARGRPYGVRCLENPKAPKDDVVLVITSDNPQDGNNQYLHFVDMSTLATKGACKAVLQTIFLNSLVCKTPQFAGMDPENGDIYVACAAAPQSLVLRFLPLTSERDRRLTTLV